MEGLKIIILVLFSLAMLSPTILAQRRVRVDRRDRQRKPDSSSEETDESTEQSTVGFTVVTATERVQTTTTTTPTTTAIPTTKTTTLKEAPCNRGWRYYSPTGSCFKIITDKLSWYEAKSRCESLDAELVKVSNRQENEHIKELLNLENEKVGFWMGLNDRRKEGTFEWLDGSYMTFSDWDSNNPSNNNNNEDCVAWWKDHTNWQWNDASCTITPSGQLGMSAVCRKPATRAATSSAPVIPSRNCFGLIGTLAGGAYSSSCNGFGAVSSYWPPPVRRCEDGWTEYTDEGLCYKVVMDRTTWDAAQNNCKDQGANLVSVFDTQQQNFLNDLLIEIPELWGFWIGANNFRRNTWIWVGDKPMTYKNWAPGQPDNANGIEHCLMWWAYAFGEWNDAPCNGQWKYLPSVCQKPVTQCGNDWSQDPITGNCFKLLSENLTWDESLRLCRQQAGQHEQSDLAFINFAETELFLKDSLFEGTSCDGGDFRANGCSVWIGLKDDFTTWSAGNPVNYTNWLAGESSNSNDCVAMQNLYFYKWWYASCNERRPALCVKWSK